MKSHCSTLSYGLCLFFSSFFLDFCVVVDADRVVVPVMLGALLLAAVRFATADPFLVVLPATAARSKIPLLKAE